MRGFELSLDDFGAGGASINYLHAFKVDFVKFDGKLIKQIGLELAKDPDLAPNILQPLKMQGIEQFGEYAINIRMKMMTKPGEQFVIRRKANAMIKKAFDENGIKFAFPTVQVSGGEAAGVANAVAAAAHQAVPEKPSEA